MISSQGPNVSLWTFMFVLDILSVLHNESILSKCYLSEEARVLQRKMILTQRTEYNMIIFRTLLETI